MTERIAPAVIPSSSGYFGRDHGAAEDRSPLPLPTHPPRPAPPDDVHYRLARVDSSGRIADRWIIEWLGWMPGDRLTLTATERMARACPDPNGMITLPNRSRLILPAALRHRCGINAGDPVLLATSPARSCLTIFPIATVHQVLSPLLGTAQAGETP